MKNKYFLGVFFFSLIITIVTIVTIVYFKTNKNNNFTESFNSNKQNFILLGDSIIKNDAYVSNNTSVNNLLIEKTNGKTRCFAVDDSTITDVYKQISQISDNFNTTQTTIFLSVGGNDILTKFENNYNKQTDVDILGTIFVSYKNVVKNIQLKFPKTNIVLFDLYFPENIKYKQYHPVIHKWNNLIYNFAEQPNNKISSVFKISNILTQKNDFTFGIEPSTTGSQKIVDIILSSY
jgi:hypothetical protein